jgi:hypothetical protein
VAVADDGEIIAGRGERQPVRPVVGVIRGGFEERDVGAQRDRVGTTRSVGGVDVRVVWLATLRRKAPSYLPVARSLAASMLAFGRAGANLLVAMSRMKKDLRRANSIVRIT